MRLRRAAALALAALLAGSAGYAEKAVTTFPPAFDSAAWTALLEKYVDARGLVAYAAWKGDAASRRDLSGYLARFSPPGGHPDDRETTALLINAYNAFAVETILDHYPVDSIRSIPGAFSQETHRIGGAAYSLDEIEHTAVRLGGYAVHATLVCASRSCPPLDRRAFRARDLTAQEEERLRAWMARSDLFRFDRPAGVARVSHELEWYRADFEREGIANVLARFAPPADRGWLLAGRYRIEYLPYDWGLNERKSAR